MQEDLLIPGIERGVRSFLPDCEEAGRCFDLARALAMERCTEPATWEKLLGASDEEIAEVAWRHGRNAAVLIVVETAAGGEAWARQHVLHQIFRPAVMQGVAQVLGMDDEGCDFNLIAEGAVADACRYFERPEVLARMAERGRRNPDKPERILKAYARWLAKKRAITALEASRPVSLDELEEKAERGEGRSPEDTESGPSAIDELRFKELVALVAERITQLPPDRRQVMQARLDNPELTDAELAALLGMSHDSFRQLLRRARDDLEDYLRRECGIIVTRRRRSPLKE